MTDTSRISGWHDFIARLEALEQWAHRNGLTLTAHALNEAKKEAGWERASTIEKLTK